MTYLNQPAVFTLLCEIPTPKLLEDCVKLQEALAELSLETTSATQRILVSNDFHDFLRELISQFGDASRALNVVRNDLGFCAEGIEEFLDTLTFPSPGYQYMVARYLEQKDIIEPPVIEGYDPHVDCACYYCIEEFEVEWYYPTDLLIWGLQQLC